VNEFDWDVRDLVLGDDRSVTYFKYKVVTNDPNKLAQFVKLLSNQKNYSAEQQR